MPLSKSARAPDPEGDTSSEIVVGSDQLQSRPSCPSVIPLISDVSTIQEPLSMASDAPGASTSYVRVGARASETFQTVALSAAGARVSGASSGGMTALQPRVNFWPLATAPSHTEETAMNAPAMSSAM